MSSKDGVLAKERQCYGGQQAHFCSLIGITRVPGLSSTVCGSGAFLLIKLVVIRESRRSTKSTLETELSLAVNYLFLAHHMPGYCAREFIIC